MDTTNVTRVSQYAPAGESAFDIWSEVCNLDGAMLVAVAYGVHATLFFTCFHALMEQRKALPKQTYAYLAYITVHFVFGTIAFACNARYNEMIFITNRDYPGGPNAYFFATQAIWINFLGYVLYICTAWLQDLLLIYRLFLFWDHNWLMLVVPGALFTTSFVVGTMLLSQIGNPGANIWETVTTNLFTVFWACEITTTGLVTLLIVGRLLHMRRQLGRVMGRAYQSQYLSIAAMLIESGLLFTVSAAVFVASYALNSPFQNMVLNAVGQIQSIAPVLIILRVAQGRGLTRAKIEQTASSARTGTTVGSMGSTPVKWARPPPQHSFGGTDSHVMVSVNKYAERDNSGSFLEDGDRV